MIKRKNAKMSRALTLKSPLFPTHKTKLELVFRGNQKKYADQLVEFLGSSGQLENIEALSHRRNFFKKDKQLDSLIKSLAAINVYFDDALYCVDKPERHLSDTLNLIFCINPTKSSEVGFNNVLDLHPTTTVKIQIISNKNQKNSKFFIGSYPTKSSLQGNRRSTYETFNSIIVEYLSGAALFLYDSDNKRASAKIVTTTSHFARYFSYLLRRARNFVFFRMHRNFAARLRLKIKKNSWSVAFAYASPLNLTNAIFKVIPNPAGRSLADPFVFTHLNETVIFVENINVENGIGSISVVTGFEREELEVKNCISEKFHMSFPHVFKHASQIFMIPETSGIKELRIYRCTVWPDKWELYKILASEIRIVDSIFYRGLEDNLLLCNIQKSDSRSNQSELYGITIDKEFPQVPTLNDMKMLTADATHARNGGFFYEDEFFYRVRQGIGFMQYGASISIAKIESVTQTDFKENSIFKLSPNLDGPLVGCHHLTSQNGITAIDILHEKNLDFVKIGLDIELEHINNEINF